MPSLVSDGAFGQSPPAEGALAGRGATERGHRRADMTAITPLPAASRRTVPRPTRRRAAGTPAAPASAAAPRLRRSKRLARIAVAAAAVTALAAAAVAERAAVAAS